MAAASFQQKKLPVLPPFLQAQNRFRPDGNFPRQQREIVPLTVDLYRTLSARRVAKDAKAFDGTVTENEHGSREAGFNSPKVK